MKMLEKGQTGPKPKVLENSPDDDFARPFIDDFSPAGGRGAACPMARSGGTVGQPDWLGLGMPNSNALLPMFAEGNLHHRQSMTFWP